MVPSPAAIKAVQAVEGLLDYRFEDSALLLEALTHKSVLTAEHHYERLEYLGDRVLGIVISEALYHHYTAEAPGTLTKRFHSLVSQPALAAIAIKLELGRYIQADKASNAAKQPSVLSDVVEALIAALYLDGGMTAAKAFINRHIDVTETSADDSQENPKSALQEWALARKWPLPQYQALGRTGPDHEPEFMVRVTIDGQGSAEASGSSKKQAERDAAALLLQTLKRT